MRVSVSAKHSDSRKKVASIGCVALTIDVKRGSKTYRADGKDSRGSRLESESKSMIFVTRCLEGDANVEIVPPPRPPLFESYHDLRVEADAAALD